MRFAGLVFWFSVREWSFSMWKVNGYRAARFYAKRQAAFVWAAGLYVIVLAAPASVRAACGDYVVHETNSAGATPFERNQMQSGRYAPADPVQPKAPCHGPHCSRGAPPPLLPLTTLPVEAERWGCIVCVSLSMEPSSAICQLESSRQQPFEHGQLIYHPPRSSPAHFSL